MSLAYPVPIYLPRRKRIVSPAEWLRDKLREREQIATKAIALDANLGSGGSAASFNTTAAAAANSRIIYFLWWFDPTATITGAGGGGLTWVVDHQFLGSGGGDQHCAIVSADAPSGLASATTITPSFSTGVDFGPAHALVSFTGLATGASGYVDATSTGKDDFEETWTTNNLVTTLADTLLVAVSVVDLGTSNTATAPATEIHDFVAESTQRMATVYRIVTSANTYQIGGVWSSSVGFQNNIGAAYEAGGPPATPGITKTDTSRFPKNKLRSIRSNVRVKV